jgi:hypothetical protein
MAWSFLPLWADVFEAELSFLMKSTVSENVY